MRMLSEGPLLTLVYKRVTGDLDSFADSSECAAIVTDCAALKTDEGRKAIDELIEINPWLEHNLALRLLKRSLGSLTPSSYRFVVSFATRTKSAALIKAAFQKPLPAGFDVDLDSSSSTFLIRHANTATRLPLADEVESGEFTYPMTMLEAIRVEQQLVIEAAGYNFAAAYPDRRSYVAFAKAGALMPN